MKSKLLLSLAITAAMTSSSMATDIDPSKHTSKPNDLIEKQRIALTENTKDKGFGPQSPRDIDSITGNNKRIFGAAPAYKDMNLCDIHFHKNAEHKGGEFTEYAGNGDGSGYMSGFKYSGKLSDAEIVPLNEEICPSKHGGLNPGDTIELHYVYSTAEAKPGNTLDTCLSESNLNPQLRVEAQVYVIVNDKNAADFIELTKHDKVNGLHQAINIPNNTGIPIQYAGSTTGPSYNTKGSPFKVSWSVRPNIMKVNAESVALWCKGNEFKEDHAHGVRNLVTDPELLSSIER